MNIRLARAYGFGDVVEAVRRLLETGGSRADVVAAIPDDLVDAVNLIGIGARIRRKLGRLSDRGVHRAVGIVSDPDAMRAFAASAL